MRVLRGVNQMKHLKLGLASGVAGVMLAVGVTAPAFAWHPEIKITKYVTNVTEGGQKEDANDASKAVKVKPGDIIVYTIVVENPAKPAKNEYNDLHFTKMTDNLPEGVELVDNPAKRQIVEDLGVLKPGDKVTKEYKLRVTSKKNGDVIRNEACVSGNSKVKDAPRKDCDPAVIKVKAPSKPVPPKEEPKEPEVLPTTGPAGAIMGAGAVTILGYLGNLLRLKSRQNRF